MKKNIKHILRVGPLQNKGPLPGLIVVSNLIHLVLNYCFKVREKITFINKEETTAIVLIVPDAFPQFSDSYKNLENILVWK